jgi:hypothetical protein
MRRLRTAFQEMLERLSHEGDLESGRKRRARMRLRDNQYSPTSEQKLLAT